jgi:hypothetical protein
MSPVVVAIGGEFFPFAVETFAQLLQALSRTDAAFSSLRSFRYQWQGVELVVSSESTFFSFLDLSQSGECSKVLTPVPIAARLDQPLNRAGGSELRRDPFREVSSHSDRLRTIATPTLKLPSTDQTRITVVEAGEIVREDIVLISSTLQSLKSQLSQQLQMPAESLHLKYRTSGGAGVPIDVDDEDDYGVLLHQLKQNSPPTLFCYVGSEDSSSASLRKRSKIIAGLPSKVK